MYTVKRLMIALAIVTVLSACTPVGGVSGSCEDYSTEVRALLDSNASGEEIQAFIDATDGRVAQLILADRDAAQACADIVFAAMFTALDRSVAAQLD